MPGRDEISMVESWNFFWWLLTLIFDAVYTVASCGNKYSLGDFWREWGWGSGVEVVFKVNFVYNLSTLLRKL